MWKCPCPAASSQRMAELQQMGHGPSPDEALQKAYDLVGKDASVGVIPDGVAVLAVKEGQA